MKPTFRLATVSDLPAILRLNNAMCAEEHRLYDPLIISNFATTKAGRSYFKEQLNKTSALLIVATFDERVTGYLSGSIHKNEPYRKNCAIASINDMAVDKKYRNQGIGKALFSSFKKWAKTRKAKLLRVVASAGNENALRFYQTNKFKPMAVILEQSL